VYQNISTMKYLCHITIIMTSNNIKTYHCNYSLISAVDNNGMIICSYFAVIQKGIALLKAIFDNVNMTQYQCLLQLIMFSHCN